MRLLSTASALALAAALAATPALAASPAGSTNGSDTSAATTPGTGNPAHAPVNNAPANSTAAAAGAAGTSATTNPGALGTAPNPGPGIPPAHGTAAYPATPRAGGTAMTPAATANANNAAPSNRNPVLTADGNVRASKVIGSAVYDSQDKQVGTIDDILLDPSSKKAATAVISVGGFLGMGAKLVTVPYDKLQFGNTNKNGDNRVVMPNATKDALNKMPSYHYTNTNG